MGEIMRFINIKKMTVTAAIAFAAILGTSQVANAQYNNRRDRRQEKKIEKQQQKIDRQQDRIDRQQDRVQSMRYRINRNGSYYNTDQRGADLLRQAVNNGYQQGFRAGQNDNGRRSRYNYNNQSMYRSGTYGYQNYVDRNQYQYYFQQGFQKGYEDGYYRRNNYGNNGTSVLGSILSTILNIQQY
jgi:flagellar biosynthesis/type III secretory pathway protein FliH